MILNVPATRSDSIGPGSNISYCHKRVPGVSNHQLNVTRLLLFLHLKYSVPVPRVHDCLEVVSLLTNNFNHLIKMSSISADFNNLSVPEFRSFSLENLDAECLSELVSCCDLAFTCKNIDNNGLESYSSGEIYIKNYKVRHLSILFIMNTNSSRLILAKGSTFFQRADHEPRCLLELLAKQIFELHTSGTYLNASIPYDPAISGAEW